jgi:hypothetical protein
MEPSPSVIALGLCHSVPTKRLFSPTALFRPPQRQARQNS